MIRGATEKQTGQRESLADGERQGAAGWRFGEFLLHEEQRRLRCGELWHSLPLKEYRLLTMLLAADGAVVDRQSLMDALWPAMDVSEAALSKLVQKLREALGPSGKHIIQTSHGRGYHVSLPVRRLHRSPGGTVADSLGGSPECVRVKQISGPLLRLSTQLGEMPVAAVRAILELAIACYDSGETGAAHSAFQSVFHRLRLSHGQQFALTQLAGFYLVDSLARQGEFPSTAWGILVGLRAEALAHAQWAADWGDRLDTLRRAFQMADMAASDDEVWETASVRKSPALRLVQRELEARP